MSLCGWWREMDEAVKVVSTLVVVGDSKRYDFFEVYDNHGGVMAA